MRIQEPLKALGAYSQVVGAFTTAYLRADVSLIVPEGALWRRAISSLALLIVDGRSDSHVVHWTGVTKVAPRRGFVLQQL